MQTQEEKEEVDSNQSKEEEIKNTKQMSKTKNYLDGTDAKSKRHFGLRNIIIGVVAAGVVVIVIELLIRGIL
jgi:tetrahydromethanopterin S-methyltransferase subunit F